jgi:hypothetical protein
MLATSVLATLLAAAVAPSIASAGAYSTLTKVSGDNQHGALGAAYAPLQVRATDDISAPVAGVQVTYTVYPDQSTGAGATFPGGATTAVVTSASTGLATAPTLTANTSVGFFEVDATTPDPTFQMVTFNLTNVSDTTPPTVSLAAPAANVSLSTRLSVAWTGSDASGVASYDVRYRKAAWNGLFGSYSTWLSATTARSAAFTGAYGSDYCFSTRARDVAGNVSGWTAQRCVAIPLDDRSLTASTGWRRLTGSAFFHGTYTQTATIGKTLTRTGVRKGRVALVATRAPGFGTVAVLYNGTLVKKVSLAYTTKQRKHVFLLPKFTASSGKIVIKSLNAKTVQIDGLVAARI